MTVPTEEERAAVLADATEVRRLTAAARLASLATIDAQTGGPFASLVNVAMLPGCVPLILISRLARHTTNLSANPAASLLITDAAASGADPLAASRVTLTGSFSMQTGEPDTSAARQCFLASHPAAAGYAGFADFGWWTMQVEAAHLVAGFGRIRTMPGSVLAGI